MPPFPGKQLDVLMGEKLFLSNDIAELAHNCSKTKDCLKGEVIGYYVANPRDESNLYLSIMIENSSKVIFTLTAREAENGFEIFSIASGGNPIPDEYQSLVEITFDCLCEKLLTNAGHPIESLSNVNYVIYLKRYAAGLSILLKDDNFILNMSSQIGKLKGIIETINALFAAYIADNILVPKKKK